MHSAPAVNYPVLRVRRIAWLLLVAWTLGATAAASWFIQMHQGRVPVGWRHGSMLAALAASTVAGWFSMRAQATGVLRWDGRNWSFEGSALLSQPMVPLRALVHLDLQTILLVRLRSPQGSSRWLWLARAAAPGHWQPLRRALFARAPAELADPLVSAPAPTPHRDGAVP